MGSRIEEDGCVATVVLAYEYGDAPSPATNEPQSWRVLSISDDSIMLEDDSTGTIHARLDNETSTLQSRMLTWTGGIDLEEEDVDKRAIVHVFVLETI
jgi:hypothetical protein